MWRADFSDPITSGGNFSITDGNFSIPGGDFSVPGGDFSIPGGEGRGSAIAERGEKSVHY